MIELCCEYLSVQCIWLYVIIMSCTFFRVNLLYSCLNVKDIFSQNRRLFWSLRDSNRIWTHNQFVRKGTLNHLAKLAKWLWVVLWALICKVSLTVFYYVMHAFQSEFALYSTPCSKQAPYLKFKWQHRDLNADPTDM